MEIIKKMALLVVKVIAFIAWTGASVIGGVLTGFVMVAYALLYGGDSTDEWLKKNLKEREERRNRADS